MKQTRGTLRCPKGPKINLYTIELLHIYWYVLDLSKEILNQRATKIQVWIVPRTPLEQRFST